jgi:hypothetical protein
LTTAGFCRYIRLLKQISATKSFYFAEGYDLTNSLQRNYEIAAKGSDAASRSHSLMHVLQSADDRFFWNREACAELIAAGHGIERIITPIINGFVCSAEVPTFGLRMLLVSRRACQRQGTRFVMRGADLDGNVANYAETEQLLLWNNGKESSFVQIRGSIPLLWEQPVTMKYTPKAVLSTNLAASQGAFNKHVQQQLNIYSNLVAINLIDKKGDQKRLGDAFEKAAAEFSKGLGSASKLRYVWFDFHHECRKMKWENLSKLVNTVSDSVEQFALFERSESGVVSRTQTGVLRTNCMDNLDRTNVGQSIFARRAALEAMGVWPETQKRYARACDAEAGVRVLS